MSKVIELTDKNFDEEVLQSDIPVLVDFWAPWCGPCKMMSPVLEELAEELSGKIKITKLNTEVPDHQSLSMKYEIQSIPNMKFFKQGKLVKDFLGFRPKDTFKSELEAEL